MTKTLLTGLEMFPGDVGVETQIGDEYLLISIHDLYGGDLAVELLEYNQAGKSKVSYTCGKETKIFDVDIKNLRFVRISG